MMKFIASGFIIFQLLSACQQGEFKPQGISHFVVIGVDGMSPNGILTAPTPVLDKLMQEGAYSLHARAVIPSSSSPNWASMIMGAGPEVHGITSNGWERDNHVLPPAKIGQEEIFPTIFSLVDQQIENAEVGAVYHWGGFGRLFEKSAVDYDVNGKSEYETARLAADYIKASRPNYLFIHLDHVDHAGHSYGHGTDKYYRSVTVADSLIGQIVAAIEAADMAATTILLITSDHGGIGYGHGGETIEEMEIPFILWGAGIKNGYEIPTQIMVYDNAATTALALNLQVPSAWRGQAPLMAFQGGPKQTLAYEADLLIAPTILPKGSAFDPPGGLFIGTTATARISHPDTGVSIHYTLDGSDPNQDSPRYSEALMIEKTTVLRAKVFDRKGKASRTRSANFRMVDDIAGHGVQYTYYENDSEEPYSDVFAVEQSTKRGEGKVLEFRYGQIEGLREEHFGLELRSFVKITAPGKYRFYTYSDDGSRLFVNGREVVDNDGDHGAEEKYGDVELQPGFAEVKVLYYNNGGGKWLDVLYQGPGVAKQILSPEVLYLQAGE
jgi:hypothetical protein